MNIPNMITMVRLVMTVFVFVLLEVQARAPKAEQTTALPWIAFSLFMIAAVSDFLDGYLARKWN
ncbi:MAG: CDP-alcohol phosphatidyltransferase family protein, partial [Planctomycetota bacterium]|nr:CDP-alcohol phosphatidyltransferase family protein [Planctomycetota bacterium]